MFHAGVQAIVVTEVDYRRDDDTEMLTGNRGNRAITDTGPGIAVASRASVKQIPPVRHVWFELRYGVESLVCRRVSEGSSEGQAEKDHHPKRNTGRDAQVSTSLLRNATVAVRGGASGLVPTDKNRRGLASRPVDAAGPQSCESHAREWH